MVKAVEQKPDVPVVVNKLEMSSLSATKANELTATFTNAVASTSAITIKVNKAGSTTAISGTTKWSDDSTSVVFTATANLTAGTYEMTATDSTDATKTTSKTVAVENERVEEIKILNEVALTSKDKKTAYIYYDVLNQYGESLKESTTINWTVSSDQTPKINKAVGKISAKRADGKDYTYGELLFVTGVYAKNGKSVQKQMSIGMEQSLDTVKTVGFVKDTDKNTILERLPANFQAGQYKMLYETYDQNGNPIDAEEGNITNNNVTFISDNVLLLKNDFKDGGIYTIKGVEYASVTIEPGQYVDKGGEVNITAISNKTGKKTIMNYVIGGTPILKSLVLNQPAEVVADGESHEIPFVATDIDGNQITNYESIVRTTNTLSLTASDDSTLSVVQKNDGTAMVVWTDNGKWSGAKTSDFDPWGSATYDDIDRSVALTTVVVGGESNNLILQVSDKARPVAVKSATLRSDATTAIVENDTDILDLSDFVFVDQYGRTMDSVKMKTQAIDFFKYSVDNGGWNKAYYGVKAEFNKNNSAFASAQISTGAAVIVTGSGLASHAANVVNSVTWKSNNLTNVSGTAIAVNVDGKEKIESVKYSVVSISTTDVAKVGTVAASDFDYVGKALNMSYSVVPMKDVTNISIKSLNKQYISLGKENDASGAEAGYEAKDLTKTLAAASVNAKVLGGYEQTIKLAGSYNGVALVIPSAYATFNGNKFNFNGTDTIKTSTLSTADLKLGDFFDASKANFVRKDGSDTISATVSKITASAFADYVSAVGADTTQATSLTKKLQQAAPKANLSFSDASPVPAKIQVAGETATFNPIDTVLQTNALRWFGLNADADGKQKLNSDKSYIINGFVWAEDQYGKEITNCNWTYSISDVKENAGDFAHLDKSFSINANDTDAVSVKGAELGDTFVIKYTASKNGGSASASVKVTVGSDGSSLITNRKDFDKDFRTKTLNYAY